MTPKRIESALRTVLDKHPSLRRQTHPFRDWITLSHIVGTIAGTMREAEAVFLAPRLRVVDSAATYLSGKEIPAPAIRLLLAEWRAAENLPSWIRFVSDVTQPAPDDAALRSAWHASLAYLHARHNEKRPSATMVRLCQQEPVLADVLCRDVASGRAYGAISMVVLTKLGSTAAHAALRALFEGPAVHDPVQLTQLWSSLRTRTPATEPLTALRDELRQTVRQRLRATPLFELSEQLQLSTPVEDFFFSLRFHGRCTSARAQDNLDLDYFDLTIGLYGRPDVWHELRWVDDQRYEQTVVVRNYDLLSTWLCDELTLDVPTVLALPTWTAALTEGLGIEWKRRSGSKHPSGDERRLLEWIGILA